MQYWIVMIDYGGRRGFEAVVHPEQTRSDVISEVIDILGSETRTLAHVKFVDGDTIEDRTDEILGIATMSVLQAAE